MLTLPARRRICTGTMPLSPKGKPVTADRLRKRSQVVPQRSTATRGSVGVGASLGISRQTAWEKWREVDGAASDLLK